MKIADIIYILDTRSSICHKALSSMKNILKNILQISKNKKDLIRGCDTILCKIRFYNIYIYITQGLNFEDSRTDNGLSELISYSL